MTNEERAQEESEQVGRTDVTAIVIDVVEALPHHLRLFPDLYGHLVTQALIAAGLITKEPS